MSIFIFSKYVWNISVVGNDSITKEELIKDVKDNFIALGTPKKSIDCNALEEELREKYTNIAWISCQVKCTNLIISIKETIPKKETIEYN